MDKINTQFSEFFALMFGGGRAGLTLLQEKKRRRSVDESGAVVMVRDSEIDFEDVEQEVESGIEIDITLPHKKTKGLEMLSGGERALTSIALLFAISQVNPPPFIILDETDAALDEANSRKYSTMIENLSKYSQLILITHNRETMSTASIIYGVTMGSDGISKLLSIQFEEAVTVAK
jgi:chromosome segregation protein